MNIRNEILEPDCFYHLYNRGVNSTDIFRHEQNYLFFLTKFLHYSKDVLDVYGYCLMPNHFHFVIKVKARIDLETFISTQILSPSIEKGLHSSATVVSKQIGKFVSSYTQAYNKSFDRHGPLLESPFKRKKIESEEYLRNLLVYVHLNPIGINECFESYKYSSYFSFLSTKNTRLKRVEVLNYFGGRQNFIYAHKHPSKFECNFFSIV